MAHDEPPYQDLHCLQVQLFSSLVLKELKANCSTFRTNTLITLRCHIFKRILIVIIKNDIKKKRRIHLQKQFPHAKPDPGKLKYQTFTIESPIIRNLSFSIFFLFFSFLRCQNIIWVGTKSP